MSTEESPSQPARRPPAFEPRPPGLRDILAIVWRSLPFLIGGLGLGIGLGLYVHSITTPTYEARAKFVIGDIPYSDPSGQTDAETDRQLVQTLIMSIPSRDMHRAIVERLGLAFDQIAFTDLDRKKDLEGPVPQANIRVDAVTQTRIGEISITSQDADFAADVGNAILDELHLYNLIGGQMRNVQTGITLAKAKTESSLQQIVEISSERIKLEGQEAQLAKHLEQGLPLAEFPSFATDATLNNLKTQLILVEAEYDLIASTATRGPRLTGKRAEVDGLRQQLKSYAQALAEALRSEFQIARSGEQDLEKELANAADRLDRLTEQSARLAQSLSDPAAMRRLAAQATENTDTPAGPANVIVTIDRATPRTKPISPKLWLNLLMGIAFGGALGAGIAAARYFLDNRIKTPAQIAEQTGLPTLTLLPRYIPLYRGKRKTRSIFDHPPYPVGLNILRSQIIRSAHDPHRRIIGLSTIGVPANNPNLAANLAILLAQAERSTLVIDLHLQSPRQAGLLGIQADRGLAEWLATDEPLSDYVSYSVVRELAVISPGHSSRDIDDLISRRPLINELPSLLNDWDFILIDAPDILSDWSLSLALPKNHSLILSADYGDTTFGELRRGADKAAENHWHTLGVVLERCPKSACPKER